MTEKEQIKEALKQQLGIIDAAVEVVQEIELPRVIAEMNKSIYDAHVKAGFDSDQAFEITKNINFLQSLSNK